MRISMYIYIYIQRERERDVYICIYKEIQISSKIPLCQTPVGLGTFSMFERASHRQPRVGSPQPQEKVLRPAGVRHLYKCNYDMPKVLPSIS